MHHAVDVALGDSLRMRCPPPEPLSAGHDIAGFTSGAPAVRSMPNCSVICIGQTGQANLDGVSLVELEATVKRPRPRVQ